MSTTVAASPQARRRQLRSPLANPARQDLSAGGHTAESTPDFLPPELPSPRAVTLAEFHDYLRTTNNRDGRPYAEGTLNAYLCPAKDLDKWLADQGVEGDFTVVDTAMLNRYAEVEGWPKTLSAEFVDDLLRVTGGGRARDFAAARDHAIIRMLRSEGIRRHELLSMVMYTLPADLIKNPIFRLVPLKGARAAGEGRQVMLAPATARALATYLRARRHHKLADSDWVWLASAIQR